MKKYEKNGKIAVLVCPGYGGGWSSEVDYDQREIICMDKRIVEFLLQDKKREHNIAPLLKELGVSIYLDENYKQLEIKWVKKGQYFEIKKYDGFETIRIIHGMNDFIKA